jgi:hypothetical protein
MAKHRMRDKLSRYLPFRRSTPQPPNTNDASSNSAELSGVVGNVILTHSSSQVPTLPTSPQACPSDKSADIAIIRSNSLNQYEPTTARTTNDAAHIDTTHIEREKEKRDICVQTTISSTERPSLWIKSFNKLSSAESATLAHIHSNIDNKISC